jgi:competence protein ComEA
MKMLRLAVFVCLGLMSGWSFAGPVNINSADASTLAKELVGVGETKAQRIVDYRTQNGPFKTADDLAGVKGISDKTIDKNRDFIQL